MGGPCSYSGRLLPMWTQWRRRPPSYRARASVRLFLAARACRHMQKKKRHFAAAWRARVCCATHREHFRCALLRGQRIAYAPVHALLAVHGRAARIHTRKRTRDFNAAAALGTTLHRARLHHGPLPQPHIWATLADTWALPALPPPHLWRTCPLGLWRAWPHTAPHTHTGVPGHT